MSSNLTRGLTLLELLNKNVQGLPLSDIAENLEVPKSTAHRLLAELVNCGYVRQTGGLGAYRLTLKLATMGLNFVTSTGVISLIQPILIKYAEMTGELVNMSIVEGDRLIWLTRAQGARGGLRFDAANEPGSEVRLFCSANGQAWLSSFSDQKALEIVSRQGFGEPGQFGPNAPNTIEEFLIRLQEARKRGYAISNESFELGSSAISAPIKNPIDSTAIGATSIAGPEVRMKPKRLEELVPIILSLSNELSSISGGILAAIK